MNAVKVRLERLERQIGGHAAGKLVVLRAGPSDDEVNALLNEIGVDADDPRNMVVILRTLFQGRDGGWAHKQYKAEILSIGDLR